MAYAREDYKSAKRLYDDLKKAGVPLWMDKEDLIPGQNWKLFVTKAIRESRSFFMRTAHSVTVGCQPAGKSCRDQFQQLFLLPGSDYVYRCEF
ncbi:MAG: TIR domain-containing protein [Desulfobacteraceae bacterium]|nr:TIR domain-containing protein [Desulfobacteraceae bacterium]